MALADRIFELLESVAKCGPATLDEVSCNTGISRSATFRGLKKLQAGGWIRLRLDGRQYVLTSRVEDRLQSDTEPKKEIEQLSTLVANKLDLRAIRIRIFQQKTTMTTELVDDSICGFSDLPDHHMATRCGQFLLSVLQYGGLSVGAIKFDNKDRTKAEDLLSRLYRDNFVLVSDDRFLWLPLFSKSSDVFLLCFSCRNYGRINDRVGNRFIEYLEAHKGTGELTTFCDAGFSRTPCPRTRIHNQ